MTAFSTEEAKYFNALDQVTSCKLGSHPLIEFWEAFEHILVSNPHFTFHAFASAFFNRLGLKNHTHSDAFDYTRELLKLNVTPWIVYEVAKSVTPTSTILAFSEIVQTYNHGMKRLDGPRMMGPVDFTGSVMLANTFDPPSLRSSDLPKNVGPDLYKGTDSVFMALPETESPVFSDRITKVLDKHKISGADRAILIASDFCEDTLYVLAEDDLIGLGVSSLRLKALCFDLVSLVRPTVGYPDVWV